ncbi:MAG: hypothetical protein C7B45_06695 [Sulfobacillus acidophilus]|uniref:PilZ domain-containing protein n=1 Tax=Sulfobacillus acidophilus TaxID=53633 RepID=A0A2T2WJU4_9FIRM|nr:MAG: hypothetical protein C7B45_06695 [Sulfobacillus acidophilus]
MAKRRFHALTHGGPLPQLGDSVLLVVDGQGIFSTSLLRVDGQIIYCQSIPAYCAPKQNLRMLFPVDNHLWTLLVQVERDQPVPDVIRLHIRGPASDPDPRQHPRYPIAVAVSAQFPDGHILRTQSTDLSLSGVGVVVNQLPPIGARLQLKLTHHHITVEVLAQVVRQMPDSDSTGVYIALMFINLATPDRDTIQTWIDEELPHL